jgi:protein involved in polysaccharide export with SLBB domain
MTRIAIVLSFALASIGLTILIAGCTEPRASTPNAEGPSGVFKHAGWHNVTTRPYRIDPPDQIRIRSPKIPELDGQTLEVRADGTAAFPLIGTLQFAGLTPMEAHALITTAASKYYVAVDLQIEILPQSKFIYVFGFGADRRGKLPYTGRTTVINAIADSGFNNQGWPQQVWISRPSRDGQDKATVVVDFKTMSETGDLSQNYLLEEGDIVYVPMSPLASWNEKMTRVLSPILQSVNAVQTPANVVNTFDNLGGN